MQRLEANLHLSKLFLVRFYLSGESFDVRFVIDSKDNPMILGLMMIDGCDWIRTNWLIQFEKQVG